MEILENYQQFQSLYRAYRDRYGKLYTNCVLPARSIPEALAEGQVQAERRAGGFLLFCRGDDAYDRLFYFLREPSPFPELRPERDLLLEELDANDRRREYLDALARELTAGGFREAAYNYLVERPCGDREQILALREEKLALLAAGGLRPETELSPAQRAAVQELWREHLKPTDVPRSHYARLAGGTAQIVCAVDGADEVCGTVWWEFRGQTCEIRHVVTRPQNRRQSVAAALLAFTLEQAACRRCGSAYTYIERDNTASLSVHRRLGFRQNGRISRQFILSGPVSE